MPTLGELISALLADAAQARVNADIEAVKIAQGYSGDPLMRHLPVPRFRLPEITVEVPVLVTDVTTTAGGRSFGEPTAEEISKAVTDGLTASGVRFTRPQLAKASAASIERAKELFASGPQRLLTPEAVARALTAAAVSSVQPSLPGATSTEIRDLTAVTNTGVSALLATKLLEAPSLEIRVTAAELKAHADDGSVVRVRLTISEDAYEIVERDDGAGFLLAPE